MTKRKTKPVDTRPGNFLADIQNAELRTVSYRHGPDSIVECHDGVRRCLPRDIIGLDGKTLVVFRTADADYSIDGWEPWHDGLFGGRYADLGSALNWVRIARGVRAGTIADFRGA